MLDTDSEPNEGQWWQMEMLLKWMLLRVCCDDLNSRYLCVLVLLFHECKMAHSIVWLCVLLTCIENRLWIWSFNGIWYLSNSPFCIKHVVWSWIVVVVIYGPSFNLKFVRAFFRGVHNMYLGLRTSFPISVLPPHKWSLCLVILSSHLFHIYLIKPS